MLGFTIYHSVWFLSLCESSSVAEFEGRGSLKVIEHSRAIRICGIQGVSECLFLGILVKKILL